MRMYSLEHLKVTECIYERRGREKQRTTYIMSLCEWIKEPGQREIITNQKWQEAVESHDCLVLTSHRSYKNDTFLYSDRRNGVNIKNSNQYIHISMSIFVVISLSVDSDLQ